MKNNLKPIGKFTEQELKRAGFKMSKPHKNMFIDALKSGDYYQIKRDYIEVEDGKAVKEKGKLCLCAVGVYLAQLNDIEDLEEIDHVGTAGIDFGELRVEDDSDDLIGHIIDMNDQLEMSFEAIADWIEDNVEGVNPKELKEINNE